MGITDFNTIKNIVRTNFDRSSELYEEFESKYGLFEFLTLDLANTCGITKGMRLCDIGCGTGTSTFVLSRLVGDSGLVYGIDFSEKMLDLARAKLDTNKELNLRFIQCGADALEDNIDSKLDAVLYNACIFLIPDHVRSLEEAYRLLKPSGMVGMNYLMGVFEDNSNIEQNDLINSNLFNQLKSERKAFAPYGRQIVDTIALPDTLEQIGFTEPHTGILARELSLVGLEEFYSIPAQSAGLWPKNSYEERLEFIKNIVQYFKDNSIEKCYQYWGWCSGKKY